MARLATGTLAFLLCILTAASAWAQGPTIGEEPPPAPGSGGSLLGRAPGTSESLFGNAPGRDQPTIGGAAGTLTPRVPPSVTVPGATTAVPPPVGMSRTPVLPAVELPAAGALSLPGGPEAAGPLDGLTLDQAIELLVQQNLDLRSRAYEIGQAEADILTASLRANPIFYADVQMVPYGRFTEDRPGGQTQYDVNLSIPLDLNHKRAARMTVAGAAKRVIEAQYQDAVRLTIDNLYTAFVDVLAARETIRFARASIEGLDQTLAPLQRRVEQGLIPPADANRVRIQREFAAIGLRGAEETHLKTKFTLAALLNLPPDQTSRFEVRGLLEVPAPPLPDAEELVRIALESRPDLAAFRLGVARADADVRLALANRFADVYWLVQPYTFQDNAPTGQKSATSWAMGLTVPLPLLNRNQGNIQRARLNVAQTQTELAALERLVVTEVQNAEKDYRVTHEAVRRVESDLLPAASQVLQTSRLQYEKGQTDIVAFLAAQRDYNDVVRQYRDLLVQHRRSMLRLNTVVGRRLLP